MTTTYGRVFAGLYNSRWTDYICRVAPQIRNFYASAGISQTNRSVLDLGCGTGQLALCFLEEGYEVIGIDISLYMLSYAVQNTRRFFEAGKAGFMEGDIVSLPLRAQFGLVVSTYYTLNHLENWDSLRRCCASVFANLAQDGFFVFDLSTRIGELRWNSICVDDSEEAFVVRRGVYDGNGDRSRFKISGFVRTSGDNYERFDIIGFNSVFEPLAVRNMLLEIGWREVHFAHSQDLTAPLEQTANEARVFVVALK